jgi:two-component system KDP operon response regulator KdpE
LTPKEYELLQLLITNAGRVMTHRALMTAIWGPRGVDQPERLRVLVGQVRKKIELDAAHPRYLLTEPWVGYRFDDAPGV